jgi:hypothetical protein
MKNPGFVARIDLTGLYGRQDLKIYQVYDNDAFESSLHWTVNVISINP